jgi:hypothetical protein
VFEESVEVAGEVAFEAAVCFASGLAFGEAAFDVGDRRWMEAFTRDQDQVERAVEFAVAASVEPVADGLAGGGRDRGGAGEACEGGFRSDAAWV